MNTPPFLLGLALIFWGLQTGLWIFAVPIAIILEGSRLISWRWNFSNDDFKPIRNICAIILFILIIYMVMAFIKSQSAYFSYVLLQWLPVALFPLVAAQIYSNSYYLDLRILFFLGNKLFKHLDDEGLKVNLGYAYFALCILSASGANSYQNLFYFILLVGLFIPLWFIRSQRFSLQWFICFILAAIMGIGVHLGLHNLHLSLQEKAGQILSGNYRQEADPFQRNTAIGDLGKVKLSDQIILRVSTNKKQYYPILLRESTYNKYNLANWFASNPQFTPVKSGENQTSWQLSSSSANYDQITISTVFNQGKGLLKLPNGTFQIDNLPLLKMEKNQYSVVKVIGQPDLLSYNIKYHKNVQTDSPPTKEDLLIPEQEKPAIAQIIKELNLQNKSEEEILKILKDFFTHKFIYALDLLGKDGKNTPLSTFLLKNRAGHCEYFASSTALILRSLSIPTRYTVGFSVNEFSNLEKQYIVREKDAHAWTLVYINGKWQEFDTTPGEWSLIERNNASKWRIIGDLWSLLWFKISLIFQQIQEIQVLKYWWFLTIPVILVLFWQFNKQKRVKRLRFEKISPKLMIKNQKNAPMSDFDLIEKALNNLGFIRDNSESLKNWIERLKREVPNGDFLDELSLIIELYYCLRFDPIGLNEDEKLILKSAIQSWLEKIP